MKKDDRTPLAEANIQAEVYLRLKALGIPIILEYSVSSYRFDAVIYDKSSKDIIVIVETKKKETSFSDWVKTKQGIKYSNIGIPIVLISCWKNLDNGIMKIFRLYNKYQGDSEVRNQIRDNKWKNNIDDET